MNYYTVYDNKSESIEVSGNAKKCADHLGIKVESFYYMISRQRTKRTANPRYTIVIEKMNGEEF